MESHFTASAFVFHNEKVLLVEHKKLGVWIYPGGHIETNETPVDAVKREVMEETGVKISFADDGKSLLETKDVTTLRMPFTIQRELIEDPQNKHYHIDLIYLCKAKNKACKINTESKKCGWFSLEETEKLNMFPSFRILLKKAFSLAKDFQ